MALHIVEEGNIFKFFVDNKQVTNIAHGCNMKGLMGAGIAKQVKDMFPSSYTRYAKVCDLLDWKEIALNLPYMVDTEIQTGKNPLKWNVYNLFTQIKPGPYANLDLIEYSIYAMLCNTKTVVMPAIGCGIGGLKFNDLVERLNKVFIELDSSYIDVDMYVIKNFNNKTVYINHDLLTGTQ